MSIDIDFTGTESPAEILKVAIEQFGQHPLGRHQHFDIFYDGTIPKMKYEFSGGPVEFSCVYRLDVMLLPFFDEAEGIFDRLARPNIIDMSLRDVVIRYIALQGMSAMLGNLPLLQLDVFGNNLNEVRLVVSSLFLHSMIGELTSPRNQKFSKIANRTVKHWIEETLETFKKRRRDYLVNFMNTQTRLHIPTSAGRPKGSTKPEEQKAREKAEFEAKIEETIRALCAATGTFPTKTAVAESLSSGPNALRIFIAKTKSLRIEYEALAERVKGSLIN